MTSPPAVPPADGFDAAIRQHDARLRALGLDIWVGSEPTFTDRLSFDAEWTTDALGAQKRRRAEHLIVRLAGLRPGAALMRSVGRQYPGEAVPRWSYGLLTERDGSVLWRGPPDPLLAAGGVASVDLAAFADALVVEAMAHDLVAVSLPGLPHDEARILMREPDTSVAPDWADDPRLLRPSRHSVALGREGLRDTLAEEGYYLFVLRTEPVPGAAAACIELPALEHAGRLRSVLDVVGAAARRCGLPSLILAGFPPPAHATLAWTTVTPDPAVVEVNMAPYPTLADFLAESRALFAATAEIGLAPHRLWYNGDVDDTGGGGHVTLGGPSPHASPFVRYGGLLPGLVRYANHHPCLSYLFAHDHLGAGGQSVRADERDREHFDELELALQLLAGHPGAQPELLWHSLAPFLADITGNSHRAELNLEKFWNPFLPGRGRLGVVEFRALRMAPNPERMAAHAALFRSVTARLAEQPFEEGLLDWGRELHDRFALPFFLGRDLRAVFADLERAGCGLDTPIRDALLDDELRLVGRVVWQNVELTVKRALEFRPLLGDVASQEQGTSRTVDASTARLELCLRPFGEAEIFAGWQIAVEGMRLPLAAEADEAGAAKVFGVRYRRFPDGGGLHPLLPAHGPVTLLLWHADRREACRITVHDWRPDGLAYDGLPSGLATAEARRQARVVVEAVPRPELLPNPPARALTPWCLDLRTVG